MIYLPRVRHSVDVIGKLPYYRARTERHRGSPRWSRARPRSHACPMIGPRVGATYVTLMKKAIGSTPLAASGTAPPPHAVMSCSWPPVAPRRRTTSSPCTVELIVTGNSLSRGSRVWWPLAQRRCSGRSGKGGA
jgi:hypothetical protein